MITATRFSRTTRLVYRVFFLSNHAFIFNLNDLLFSAVSKKDAQWRQEAQRLRPDVLHELDGRTGSETRRRHRYKILLTFYWEFIDIIDSIWMSSAFINFLARAFKDGKMAQPGGGMMHPSMYRPPGGVMIPPPPGLGGHRPPPFMPPPVFPPYGIPMPGMPPMMGQHSTDIQHSFHCYYSDGDVVVLAMRPPMPVGIPPAMTMPPALPPGMPPPPR